MITEALLAAALAPVHLSACGHTFRMVPVRGGTFDMGDERGGLEDSERPVHRVLLDDFWVGQFPVTQALWRVVAESPGPGPRRGLLDPDPSFFKGDNRPVEQVSWDDVQVFLEKLNLVLPGRNFRLPTEAEWEYAARGGNPTLGLLKREGDAQSEGVTSSHPLTTRYGGSDRLETVAWWGENSHIETKPVGLKLPNALGLFDMSGNVSEWCADWYDSKFYEKCTAQGVVKNPLNVVESSGRVLRGGSWISSTQRICWVAYRHYYDIALRFSFIGFRLAASPPGSLVGP